MSKGILLVFFLFSYKHQTESLKCYISPIPIFLNYSVTANTLPTIDNSTLIDVTGECTFTILWLRNPEQSFIVLGYNQIDKNKQLLNDKLLASVQYAIEGDELQKRLSRDIQYQCQTFDQCNDRSNIKRILNSIDLEENFSTEFNWLISKNQSFNNQSIRQCYVNRTNINRCSPVDYSNCRRCEISANFSRMSIDEICATCPTQTEDFNFIKRDAIFITNNGTQILDRVQLSCQLGQHCNSIENIYLIRQASRIQFNFTEFLTSKYKSSLVTDSYSQKFQKLKTFLFKKK